MQDTDSYAMQKKVEGEMKGISLKTKACDVILNDGTTLDAKMEEISSIIDDLSVIIDEKIVASEELYNRIMNSINSSN